MQGGKRYRRIIAVMACLPLLAARAVPTPATEEDDERVLAEQNHERSRIGVPPLRWNTELAARAARYAGELAAEEEPVLRHDPLIEDVTNIEGENIWMGTHAAYRPEDMVGLWLQERAAFHNGVFPNVSTTGNYADVAHYTQIIWRSTTEIGCAIRKGVEYDVLVCRYLEGGNVMGERSF